MRKYKYALTLFFIFLLTPCLGQQVLRGRVILSRTGAEVPRAIITIHKPHSTAIAGYTQSNEKGAFEVKYMIDSDSVEVKVRQLSIEPKTIRIPRAQNFIDIEVNEESFKLNEVKVQAPKIRQKGDTILYNVAQFSDITDRSIGDVLAKLPGIQVTGDGQIFYQQKPINKFYIEGLDMLEGKYNLATKNIDANKVASVEVLENHQPIKVLKGLEVPDEAAINLRLKPSSLGAFFGNAQLGIGASPLLFNNELVGMRFLPNQQDMAVYKGDNSGIRIARELSSLYGSRQGVSYSPLGVVAPGNPDLSERQYLFNDTHIASLNHLHKLSKETHITGSLNYIYDRTKREGYSEEELYLESGDTIWIPEEQKARFYNRQLEGSLVLETNTDRTYLKNIAVVNSYWNSKSGSIVGENPIHQNLRTPNYNLENNFSYKGKTKNDNQYYISSTVKYNQGQSTLLVQPSTISDVLGEDHSSESDVKQKFDVGNFETSLSGGFKKVINSSFFIDNKIETSFSHYLITSDLFQNEVHLNVDSLKNNFRRTEYSMRYIPWFDWTVSRRTLVSLKLPLEYLSIYRKDYIRDKKTFNYFYASPSFHLKHKYNLYFEQSLYLRYRKKISGIGNDHQGYILSNYRRLSRNEDKMSTNSSYSISLSTDYKNIFKNIFSSLDMSYSQNRYNQINSYYYNDIFSTSQLIDYKHTAHRFLIALETDKSFNFLNTSMSIGGNYGYNEGVVMNQLDVSSVYSNTVAGDVSIHSQLARRLFFKYKVALVKNWYKIGVLSMPSQFTANQRVKLSYTPIRNLILTTSFEHYYNDAVETSGKSSWFGNVQAEYRMKYLDLILDWTNIFNTKQYTQSSYGDFSRYYQEYKLRPFEVMLKARFKLF